MNGIYKNIGKASLAGILAVSAVPASSHDLTGVILTNQSADCADYVGSYSTSSTDINRRLEYDGEIVISANENSCTIESSNIPNHDVNDGDRSFRNQMQVQNQSFTIARNPQIANRPTDLSQRYFDGVMLNGVPIDVLSAGCFDPSARHTDQNGNTPAGCSEDHAWLIDPPSANGFFAEDSHAGHAQPDGTYHYHGNPMALFDPSNGSSPSPVIGFAADGFPIYGSYFEDENGKVRKAISGYEVKDGSRPSGDTAPGGEYDGFYISDWEFTGNGDLDACNGMYVDGQYGYYITDAYPWILKCHAGTPDRSFSKR